MEDAMRIAVVGASGRMGRQLIAAVVENPATKLCGATERPDHEWVGQDVGTCLGGAPSGVIVSSDPGSVFADVDAVLEFSTPQATVDHAAIAGKLGTVHVIGTTGLQPDDIAAIAAAARQARIIRAGNMSLGVNLLTALTKKVAAALDADFDIEIVESHHNQKVDAPSGTALMLGEAAAEGRGQSLEDLRDPARDGITGVREKGHVGFAALRGGDVVGEHDVIFAGAGERLILRHIATDRMLFARGAVKAALWGRSRPAGEYSMLDVLGLA